LNLLSNGCRLPVVADVDEKKRRPSAIILVSRWRRRAWQRREAESNQHFL
jgi:hypothetical protein